ncbi:hypothetical protein HY483_01360 [Candidatus Woesearchaeota archaeon]|nr:hypothetical protein [Candidatus Woesearchaeota archaeon]
MTFKKRKNSQATGATMLILVLIGIFLLFAMVTNPEKFQNTMRGSAQTAGVMKEYTIGVLQGGTNDDNTKTIQGFTLQSLQNTKVLARFPDVSASNGIFRRSDNTKTFMLEDPKNTDNIFLSFTATEKKGTLAIILNDNALFNGILEETNPAPIKIPAQYIKKDNSLKFSTESGFLQSAAYTLKDVSLIGTVTDITPLTKKSTFTITQEEYEITTGATLKYFARCDEETIMEIILNKNTVKNGTITCEEETTNNIPKSSLKQGANTITFTAQNKNTTKMNNIKIELSSTNTNKFVTSFNIQTRPRSLKLELELPEQGEKIFNGVFNAKPFHIRTSEFIGIIDLTNSTTTGTNYLEITPEGTVNVPKARIRIS